MKLASQTHEQKLTKYAPGQYADNCATSSEIRLDYSACPELHRAIRLPELLHVVGLRRSAWYGLLNPRSPSYDPRAPKPFRLGRNASAWWLHEVLAYVQQLSITSRAH